MSQPKNYPIQDKPVLSKVANVLFLAYDFSEETNIVSIHPNIYRLVLPPTGQTEIPAVKTNVFFDDFIVEEANLPAGNTLDERVLSYVCNIWGLTLI